MKIGIITDSSAYLDPQAAIDNQITVLPVTVIWGGKTYRDLIDISSDEFYQRLATDSTLPTSSQPSVGETMQAVDSFIDQAYTDVIIITLSSGISGYYRSLIPYAQEEKRIKVHVFDSKITCAGQAQMAILAAKLAKEGKSVEQILAALKDLQATMGLRFMVTNLSHLARTGRLSNASSFIGGLLKITPILSMDIMQEGKISAIGKERQEKRAFASIKRDFKQAISGLDYPLQATIFDAAAPAKKAQWLADLQAEFPQVRFESSIIGPVVGVHTGQGAVAIIWHKDINTYLSR